MRNRHSAIWISRAPCQRLHRETRKASAAWPFIGAVACAHGVGADADAREFLLSVEREMPDFERIGLPQAANLPALRRKLQNLAQRSAAKREADYRRLAETLERF